MYRIFILGAGFSKPAGLPLANELWETVLSRARRLGFHELLEREFRDFDRFRKSRGDDVDTKPLDFEEFMAFLDLEHALGFEGSDQLSAEGSRTQLLLKWLIAQIIVEATPRANELPDCYIEFADLLQPNDFVITFNYDNLLEKSLDQIHKPYRLFPTRFEEIDELHNVVDTTAEEVIIIKMHGSVDWFDRSFYDFQLKTRKRIGSTELPSHLIFGPGTPAKTVPLLEAPQQPDDPLITVERVVSGLKEVYQRPPNLSCPPLMLSPSAMKVLYAHRLKNLYWGLGQIGGFNLGLIVIGYSLPRHDDYARQLLLHVFSNYQQVYWEEELAGGMRKGPALLIDYRIAPETIEQYRLTYSFSEEDKTRYHLTGFGAEALAKIRDL